MSKQKKLLIKIVLWIAVLAIAAAAGYFILFHDTDVLRIQYGKIQGQKPTWLTVRTDGANGESQYYKLGDVNAPRNYTAQKNAADLDGDPLTTQFIYKGKNAQNPGVFQIQAKQVTDEAIAAHLAAAAASDWMAPVAMAAPEEEQADEEQGLSWGWRRTGSGKTEKLICVYPLGGGDAQQICCLVPTHYAQLYAEILITLDAPAGINTWLSLADTMAAKVTPGIQLHPLVADFKLNFIDENRWEFLVDGLGVTLLITLFATILGVIIGVIVAGVCSTWDKNGERMRKGIGKLLLQIGNKICRVFLTVIRGTPVVIQLMLFYFVILVSVRDWNLGFLGTVKSGVIVAIIAFGINSGAYVAEIIRGGIMSIDQGQFEAGRSLGFNYIQTMWHIIIPQALKNVLPSLANEFIVLLKETSVAGYVAVQDLTKAGDIIKGVTYSPFLPLIAVAIIYLILVMFFTWLVGKLERRLRNSEH